MLHVSLQLELKRLKLIGSRKLLWVSEFNADEHSSIGQVYPMVDARRWNPGPFDHLPHFVHQAQANLAVSLVLDNAPDAVQVEPNWFVNDLDFHLDAVGSSVCSASIPRYFILMLMKGRNPRPRPSNDPWSVYILRCADGSLYTGITKDAKRRGELHNAGTASRYTRSRRPTKLVWQEIQPSQSAASKREAAIKALSRRQKESIIVLAG
jgi:predicted GIY-YIG superfamily endonuclease